MPHVDDAWQTLISASSRISDPAMLKGMGSELTFKSRSVSIHNSEKVCQQGEGKCNIFTVRGHFMIVFDALQQDRVASSPSEHIVHRCPTSNVPPHRQSTVSLWTILHDNLPVQHFQLKATFKMKCLLFSGKGRTKKESEQHTNQHDPSGHTRKTTQKLINSHQKQKDEHLKKPDSQKQ